MNILFTSAGRRGYLLRYFKEELAGKGLIHAANSSEMNPAFLEADRTVVSPLIHDESYIGFLLDYCRQNSINAIIPLFDIDFPVLAANRALFEDVGVTLVASSLEVALICNDKWKTYDFLKRNRFHAPQSYISLEHALEAVTKDELSFPVVLKPRWGMGSIGIYIAENMDELRVLHAKTQRDIERSYLKYESCASRDGIVLIQELLSGREYGLDVINDLNGCYITTFVKKKLAMRAGETDAAISVRSALLSELGKEISICLGHTANLDMDVFLVNGKPFILEMNARFGGGYPFSQLAGANLPKAILSWLEGKVPDPACFIIREGVKGIKVIEPYVFRCSDQ